MKAIIVTQHIIEKNPHLSWKAPGEIQEFPVLPSKFIGSKNCGNDYALRTDLHEVDGFKEVVIPEITSSQKLGNILFDQDNAIFTYEIVEKTLEELAIMELKRIQTMPTLAALYASEIGIQITREIDLPIDHVEIFTPKEKVYDLLGHPLYKEYYKDDTCVCRLEYHRVYEDLSHEGITKQEFTGTKTKFIFYKDQEREHFLTKEKQTKTFALVPTPVRNESDQITDVLWSSADREGLLRAARYKSEQVMKSFNPNLYRLFVGLWNDLYMIYKETGQNQALISQVQSHPLAKLDEEVQDDDKAVIFGPMDVYPPLTIRQLIIKALP